MILRSPAANELELMDHLKSFNEYIKCNTCVYYIYICKGMIRCVQMITYIYPHCPKIVSKYVKCDVIIL